MLEKLSKMSIREAMITLAGPPEFRAQARWFSKVAKQVEGVTFRTVRSLWHDEIKNPDQHWAAKAIRAKAELQKARREATELASQYESIARSLNATDQDFYSPDVAALLHAARLLRNLDRSRTDGT